MVFVVVFDCVVISTWFSEFFFVYYFVKVEWKVRNGVGYFLIVYFFVFCKLKVKRYRKLGVGVRKSLKGQCLGGLFFQLRYIEKGEVVQVFGWCECCFLSGGGQQLEGQWVYCFYEVNYWNVFDCVIFFNLFKGFGSL